MITLETERVNQEVMLVDEKRVAKPRQSENNKRHKADENPGRKRKHNTPNHRKYTESRKL